MMAGSFAWHRLVDQLFDLGSGAARRCESWTGFADSHVAKGHECVGVEGVLNENGHCQDRGR